ncbi:MAG: DEAD/DEAH box helicase family protein [Ignavibacteriaceae bacterium]|nr:DEAD/DEAH box helicase family protein [Ignavibacteriaceae bacterium]
MSTKFFTNNSENTLLDKFKGVFTYNQNIHFFDALVGYFRSSGYFKVRPFLDNVPKIRILVGINVDKLTKEFNRKGLEPFWDTGRTKEEFIEQMHLDIQNANYDKTTEDGIIQFIQDVENKKIQLRAHPGKNIHAKVYIFKPEGFNQHTPASVITGSSNFTEPGLGSGKNTNYEFNVQLNDYDDVLFATSEFEKLWSESVDILPDDVTPLKEKTYLNDKVTPFELYVKLLIEYFGDNIDYNPATVGDLPPYFKKLSYQVDAVNEGFNMLLKHNGFILADVVGLGKTVIAAMIANMFLHKNGKENSKILVVYPPAIEKNWKNTFKEFKIDNHTKFVSNGSLFKILDGNSDYWNKEDYDLVIVDESHKFRNHETGIFKDLQIICKSPRNNKGSIPGRQKKVVLVTATPLNNNPGDILHQISMFQDTRQSTLPVSNLTSFFAPLIAEYKSLIKKDKIDLDKLRKIYGDIRKNVVEPITVRRTRKDIENNDDYKNDIIQQGIVFPEVMPPEKVEYFLDENLNQLFYNTVFYLTDPDKIKYYRYQAIFGLKENIQSQYYENAERSSKALAHIMKTQLVKRLESSFYSFKKSLNAFHTATERMIAMFENNKIYIAPDLNINQLLEKGISEEEIEKLIEEISEENPKNRIFTADDFEPWFLDQLKKDSSIIKDLVDKWNKIDYDPKLKQFLNLLDKKFLDPAINLEGKLVIFSEAKDTVDYLTAKLNEAGRNDVLNISADNRNSAYNEIVANFDANIPLEKQKDKYNILISTEVLAEGVNLHRSNVVIHYDTPWNSTKLMQRIGRVNRIGAKAPNIYNFVFYPSTQGDQQIKLNKTALTKIQAFHTAFGEDNQVYSVDEILDDVKLFDGQLKEEEDERLKYLFFIRKFKRDNKAKFDFIKKLPVKSRVSRNSELIKNGKLNRKSAVFLKTVIKNEFYLVHSNLKAEVITPLEAIKIFEAEINENSTPLPDFHHEHVKAAITHFDTETINNHTEPVTPDARGGVARQSKKFLIDLLKFDSVDIDTKENIQKMHKLIDVGKFTNLPKDVNTIQKKFKDFNSIITELNKIVIKYDIPQFEFDDDKLISIQEPQLIISESFI